MFMCVCRCVYVYVCVCVCGCVYVYVCECVYGCVYVYVYVCGFVWVCVCVCVWGGRGKRQKVAQLVEALRYKPGGDVFDSR